MKERVAALVSLIIVILIEAIVILDQWVLLFHMPGTVPITRLGTAATYTLLWVVWPLVGSLLFVVLFPRILSSIVMRTKASIWRSYKNFVVPLSKRRLTPRMFVLRTVYLALLIMGIVSILMPYINPNPFLPGGMYDPGDPGQAIVLVASIGGIVAPFAVGFWSVSWSMQDAALMHYKFPPEDNPDLFEIEPVHIKYESLLKGYAGLSSILFIITLVLYVSPGGNLWAILVPYVVMHMTLLTIPALLIHSRVDVTWLRRDLPEARKLTESDIEHFRIAKSQ
ncbi:MAG: hypothetical protein ACFFD6_01375 [Candidatus Thorarchaeota archaeon]